MISFPGSPPLSPPSDQGWRWAASSCRAHCDRQTDRQPHSGRVGHNNTIKEVIDYLGTKRRPSPTSTVGEIPGERFTDFNSVINLSLSLWETTGVQVFYYCTHYIYIYVCIYRGKDYFFGNIRGILQIELCLWRAQSQTAQHSLQHFSLSASLCNRTSLLASCAIDSCL